jgi:hypothetical protein
VICRVLLRGAILAAEDTLIRTVCGSADVEVPADGRGVAPNNHFGEPKILSVVPHHICGSFEKDGPRAKWWGKHDNISRLPQASPH